MMKKQSLFVIGVYLLAVFIPFLLLVLPLDDFFRNNIFGIIISIYVPIVSPILFIIPYKKAKLENIKEKIVFIFFGFILPFAIIYYYLYLDYQRNFHPGF